MSGGVLDRFESETVRWVGVAAKFPVRGRSDPGAWCPVVAKEKDLRRRRSRCSLYSVGPSWGSASSRVTLPSCSAFIEVTPCPSGPVVESSAEESWWNLGRDLEPDRGGVDHGEDTRGGSGSKVKMDAMTCHTVQNAV